MGIMTIFIVAALLLTMGSLAWGIISMAHGGKYDQQHSDRIMAVRVGFQVITVLLLLIALFV